MKKFIYLFPLFFLMAACSPCGDGQAVLERLKNLDDSRLSLLHKQLSELYKTRKDIFEYSSDFSPIPKELEDLNPRKIRFYEDHAYVSFFFCVDHGIQFDVYGFEPGSTPRIELSWGEPGINYKEEIIWKD